jgi:hypothetical protein
MPAKRNAFCNFMFDYKRKLGKEGNNIHMTELSIQAGEIWKVSQSLKIFTYCLHKIIFARICQLKNE